MSQVYHFQNFYVTRLREAVDESSTTIYVDNPPTISSGILVIEGKNASKREIIYFSSVSGYALNDCARGLEGTIPNTHNQGATVEQAVTAGQLDQVLSPHILLQGLGNDENAAMSQDAITRVITNSHNTDGTLKNKIATLGKINGGSIDGVLLTDASGNVTGRKVTASKLDSASFINADSNGWKVTTLPSGKKQYRMVVVGLDVSVGGNNTSVVQNFAPPTGVTGTDILAGVYLLSTAYTSNAPGWDRMIPKCAVDSTLIKATIYNSIGGSLNTGNQARWHLELTEM